ncbi:FkbM family methyltransferase [Roseovarius sp. SYSU LYC5161]|uniref:FkbM family methyltransferase n=1 Tax=Roseovarius halophilus (ex Wu et al. 2025) TaxID=3376060 RepID=UPI00399BB4BA
MPEFQLNGVTLSVPEAMLGGKLADKLSSAGYEAHEARAALMRLRAGQRVLELGGGLGYVSAVCAGVTGAENVVTVEANPDMLPVIRGNLDRNGFGEARLVHGAVVGTVTTDEPIAFDRKKTFWAGRLADMESDPGAVVNVPVLRLDTLLARYRPDMVVMDVEGAERLLFDAPWPAHVRNVILELHPGQYPDSVIKTIVDCMSASGLTYDPGPSRGRILGFRRVRGK